MKKLFIIILFSLFILFPNNSEAAIAFDTGTDPVLANATSLTFAHTCTGDSRILFVTTFIRNDHATGVTYNGVAMTSLGLEIYQDPDYVDLYYLIAPATGTNNIVISREVSGLIIGGAVSYTGAKQSGVPDASYSNLNDSGTEHSGTVTTIADNCWAVMTIRCASAGKSTAGEGTTRRINIDTYFQMYDGNGPKTPAGSYTLNAISEVAETPVVLMASFAPVAPTDTCTPPADTFWQMDLQDHCTTTVSTYSDYGMECYNPVGGSWVIGANTEVRRGSSTNCIPQIEATGVFSIQPSQ